MQPKQTAYLTTNHTEDVRHPIQSEKNGMRILAWRVVSSRSLRIFTMSKYLYGLFIFL